MTRICRLTEIGELTACQNDKTYAYDDKNDSHRDEDLTKDSLWQRKRDEEVYGHAHKKWNPKNDFSNFPTAFMRGISVQLRFLS